MSTGHGNHWECLQKPALKAIEHFIPETLARGKIGAPVRRVGRWFRRKKPTEEVVTSIVLGSDGLRSMALLVSDQKRKSNVLYSAYPCAAKGAKQHLRLTKINAWGNEVEAVLECETKDRSPVAFFDTQFFANRDQYRVGSNYDFHIAGLVYSASCTNDETIKITNQKKIAEYCAAFNDEPERLPDGRLAPLIIKTAGCTGYAGKKEYPEDAEFYCVIGKVVEFDLEGIRIFQITPKLGNKSVPLPGLIFGAASAFKDGYVPRVGDSIGGGIWTMGFLNSRR